MSSKHRSPSPLPSVDGLGAVRVELVLLTVVDSDLKVMLIKRQDQPFRGTWSLPGNFLGIQPGTHQGEDLKAAAQRTLTEQTGLKSDGVFLEQIQTFGRAGRDPRMRVISVAWCALVPPSLALSDSEHEDDSGAAHWFSAFEEAPWIRLAFDHAEILQIGIEHIQRQIDHTDLAFDLVPPTFTVGELRDVYEAIKAKRYDPRNFRRRFQRMLNSGLVEEAPGKRHLGKSRPAKVWRLCSRKS